MRENARPPPPHSFLDNKDVLRARWKALDALSPTRPSDFGGAPPRVRCSSAQRARPRFNVAASTRACTCVHSDTTITSSMAFCTIPRVKFTRRGAGRLSRGCFRAPRRRFSGRVSQRRERGARTRVVKGRGGIKMTMHASVSPEVDGCVRWRSGRDSTDSCFPRVSPSGGGPRA